LCEHLICDLLSPRVGSGERIVVTIDVRHDGLGRLERVWAPTQNLAEQRAEALKARWDAEFHDRPAPGDADAKRYADDTTHEAERAVGELTSILITALRVAPATDWSPLMDVSVFAEAAPVAPPPPQQEPEPKSADFPRAPLTLMTLVNPRALRRRRDAAETKFTTAHDGWLYLKRWRENEYAKALTAHREALEQWKAREAAFGERQAKANARLETLQQGYRDGEPDAVTGHCDLNLLSLDRPKDFPVFWTTRYADGVVTLDYDLPNMDVVPVVKAVKYVPSRAAYDVAVLPEAERERIYGEAVFQTALAVLRALFAGDAANVVRAVAFNGWVNYIDGAALRPGRAVALSVTVDKSLFAGIDLGSVDPQACFRALNGSMSSKLASLVGAKN
jgi:restriction system protein